MDGVDGDEKGRGFSEQGARHVVSPLVPRDHRWTSAGLGVARHLVSPTGRWGTRGSPRDGFRRERTRGLLPPEVGILSILVMPWDRVP